MLQWYIFCHRLHVDFITCTVAYCTKLHQYTLLASVFQAGQTPPTPSLSLFWLQTKLKQEHAAYTAVQSERANSEATNAGEGKRGRIKKDMEENTSVFFRSTCFTILPQLSSLHIQLRYKVQPFTVCLQLASIMDGIMCKREGVWLRSEEISKRRGGGGGPTEWKHQSPIMFSPLFPPHSFPYSNYYFCCYYKYRVVHTYAFLSPVCLFQSSNLLLLYVLCYYFLLNTI